MWSFELYRFWTHYNQEYVGGALQRPVIVVADAMRTLGAWDGRQRVLSIAATHLADDPWPQVMVTLRHEMAHQYAEEVLGAVEESPHGRAFAEACQRLRVSPAARGKGAAEPASGPRSRIVDVVGKLLALGRSPNENEAAAAVRKARELLLRYNIQLVELAPERRFSVRWIGELKGRHHAWEYTLSSVLNDFFFVQVIWTPSYDTARNKRGSVLEIYGTEENLDMATYVWSYLSGILPRLWEEYRQRRGIDRNRERHRYYDGVLHGFWAKLKEQETRMREERALVFAGDPALTRFFRHLNPRTQTAHTGGFVESPAYRDGRCDGRSVELHRPVTSREDGGKLLPG
jgi:hypothetical protein